MMVTVKADSRWKLRDKNRPMLPYQEKEKHKKPPKHENLMKERKKKSVTNQKDTKNGPK